MSTSAAAGRERRRDRRLPGHLDRRRVLPSRARRACGSPGAVDSDWRVLVEEHELLDADPTVPGIAGTPRAAARLRRHGRAVAVGRGTAVAGRRLRIRKRHFSGLSPDPHGDWGLHCRSDRRHPRRRGAVAEHDSFAYDGADRLPAVRLVHPRDDAGSRARVPSRRTRSRSPRLAARRWRALSSWS